VKSAGEPGKSREPPRRPVKNAEAKDR